MPFANKYSTFFVVIALVAFSVLAVQSLEETIHTKNAAPSEDTAATELEQANQAIVVNADGSPYTQVDPTTEGDWFEEDKSLEDFVDPYEIVEDEPSSFETDTSAEESQNQPSAGSSSPTSGRID